jgi:hypothetical protein
MPHPHLFDLINAHIVPETTLRAIDPSLHAFINLNTPEALEQAEAIYRDIHGRKSED